MDKGRHHGLSATTSRLTSTVSVTLVLLLLSLIAGVLTVTRHVAASVASEIGFVTVMSPEATANDINAMHRQLNGADYTAGLTYSSPEEVNARWIEMMGTDSVELQALESLDENPFLPEFEVKVKPAYSSSDSLNAIAGRLERNQTVDKVVVQAKLIDDVNSLTRNVVTVLLIVACALIAISFVLINNTIRLTVYARRFTIHTMRLVGATNGFIRRPFLVSNIIIGIVAAAISDIVLAALTAWSHFEFPEAIQAFTWTDYSLVAIATFIIGIGICALAALFATNKYLGQDYDSLFGK